MIVLTCTQRITRSVFRDELVDRPTLIILKYPHYVPIRCLKLLWRYFNYPNIHSAKSRNCEIYIYRIIRKMKFLSLILIFKPHPTRFKKPERTARTRLVFSGFFNISDVISIQATWRLTFVIVGCNFVWLEFMIASPRRNKTIKSEVRLLLRP